MQRDDLLLFATVPGRIVVKKRRMEHGDNSCDFY